MTGRLPANRRRFWKIAEFNDQLNWLDDTALARRP